MQLREALCLIVLAGLACPAFAQDQIYKKNGQSVDVTIKEVSEKNIVYKRYDNQSGPDYVIPKNEVARIRYENGTEEVLNGSGRNNRPEKADDIVGQKPDRSDYGKNILAFSPIAMTNTSATGIGLSYEHVLDDKGIFSFYLPVTLSFRTREQNVNNTYPYDRGNATVAWAYPGVKIYPTGSNRRVSYAIGASIPLGFGNETERVSFYNNQGQYVSEYRDNNIFLMGGMLTNYLNIQPTKKLFLGMQLGFGIPYIRSIDFVNPDDRFRYYNSTSYEPWVEFSFRIGYRF